MKRKKILIVSDNLEGQINGVVTTYKNLESYATADGYDIYYLNPGRFRYVDCPKYNEVKLTLTTTTAVGKAIKEISPDYIHLSTEGPMGLFARRYLTVHGYRYNTAYHTKFPEGIKAILGIPEAVTWPLIRWFHSNSNRVLTTTPSMVNDLIARGFKNNIISWTRGVDRDLFKPINRDKNQELTLLCVSRVSAEKNLEAFFKLDFPTVRKVMVGDGPKLNEYKQKYPDVDFVGFKRGNELARYYQQADVFVFPSRWDTFGIVMIEAMACGTPVAAYPVTGPADVIDQGITGIMHNDLNEAVQQCLSIDREQVYLKSLKWSWEQAWEIFRDNLIEI